MLDDIKVSVIIPTYKRSEFLTRALDSVLNQTHKNIEVIIVDDNVPGSKYIEETYSAVVDYLKDERFIYIKNENNLGAAMARNRGIEIATGEYITFLDDDDIFLPSKIEKQLKFMVDNNLDMSFMNFFIYNKKNKLIDYRIYDDIKKFDNEYLFKYHLQKHITGTYSYMFKKELLTKIQGFEDKVWGDEFYLMVKTILSGAKIKHLNESLVIHYIHDSETLTNGSSKLSGVKELHQFKKKHFEKFTLREKMFIRFRHNVVLAITFMRGKKMLLGLYYFLLALLSSPIDFVKEPLRIKMKMKKVVSTKNSTF